MAFNCTVKMPGPYVDSVAKIREFEPKPHKKGERAMSYVMNLRIPEFPEMPSLFKKDPAAWETFFKKTLQWCMIATKIDLIHTAVGKAKAQLADPKNENTGLTMEAFLKTEGNAELLTAAAYIPTEAFELDFGTAALASTAWYLKAEVKCVKGKNKPEIVGNSAEFIKKGDSLFEDVVKRSGLVKSEILSINCDNNKKTIWDRLPLAILTYAYNLTHPYCGRGGGNRRVKVKKKGGTFGTQDPT